MAERRRWRMVKSTLSWEEKGVRWIHLTSMGKRKQRWRRLAMRVSLA